MRAESRQLGARGAGRIADVVRVVFPLCALLIPALIVFAPSFPKSGLLCAVVGLVCAVSFFLLLLEKYEEWACLVLLVLTMFPAEATGILSGYNYTLSSGLVNISLAGYVSLVMFLHVIVFSAHRKIVINIELLMWAFLALSVLVLTRVIGEGFPGLMSNRFFDSFGLPLLLLIALASLPKIDINKVLKYLLFLLVVDAVFACVEYGFGHNLVYDGYFSAANQWYQQIVASSSWGVPYRSSSLIGHPLTLAVYMNLGLILAITIPKNTSVKVLLCALFFAAQIVTNSRGGLLILCLIVLYLLEKKNKAAFVIAAIALVVSISILGVSGYNALFSRDISGGSLATRIQGIQAILSSSPADLLMGVGFRDSQAVVSSFTESVSNVEVGPLLMLLQIGLFSFTVMAVFIGKAFSVNNKRNKLCFVHRLQYVRTIDLLLLTFFLESFTYNSIGDPGQMMYLASFLLGLRILATRSIPSREDGCSE